MEDKAVTIGVVHKVLVLDRAGAVAGWSGSAVVLPCRWLCCCSAVWWVVG